MDDGGEDEPDFAGRKVGQSREPHLIWPGRREALPKPARCDGERMPPLRRAHLVADRRSRLRRTGIRDNDAAAGHTSQRTGKRFKLVPRRHESIALPQPTPCASRIRHEKAFLTQKKDLLARAGVSIAVLAHVLKQGERRRKRRGHFSL